MSRIVADREQRQQAINAEASYIVRAPAGSGKTELLIQRFLRLLSLVDAPEEIVAITFTRKAAAEMQSRILAALALAVLGEEPEAAHARQTFHLARAVLLRDRKLDWQLLQNPARLKVQTIDSLCATLTRQMPLLSGLGAQPETVEDAGELYEQAAINTLAELDSGVHWSDSIARLLEHLDNDLPRVKQLIMDMLGKRDQWLRHVAREHQREDLESSLQHVIMDKLERGRRLFPAKLASELCEIAAFAALNLGQSDPQHPTSRCQSMTELPGSTIQDLETWLGLCELLLRKDGEWRQQLNVKNGFPAPKNNKAEFDIRKDMKSRAQTLIQQLRNVPDLVNTLDAIRQLPPPVYSDEEWEVVAALCRLLTLAEGQLRLVFAENNQMDFTGIAHAAIETLGTGEAPTDLAQMLDYRIRHLMVDEYQDISVNQAILLERLTAGWSGEDGHTLFLVGDPMQSIYRFREAEVGIFINTWQQRRLGQVALTPLAIHTNFRSQPGLVEWVNNTFGRIMPAVEDVTTGAVSYETSSAYHNVQPIRSVSVYPAFTPDSGGEASRIADLLAGMRSRDPGCRIAILVRSRAHLLNILPALRETGVPYQAVDIEGLGTQPEVQDLMALIRALTHPADRIAWLAILRAPWCGLSLEDLHVLMGSDRGRTVWECINDEDLTMRLDDAVRMRVDGFRNIIRDALDMIQRDELQYTVESAWLRLGGPVTLRDRNQLSNVLTVLECLNEASTGGCLEDTAGFIEKVNALFSNPVLTDEVPVQVMTVHKAKGLEFDHVLLPGLGRRTRGDQPELLLWQLISKSDQGQGLILAPIRETGQPQAPVYDYVNRMEKQKQYNEDIRLLYVATTRARFSLHLFGHANIREDDGEVSCTPPARSFLTHLWPLVEPEYRRALAQYAADEAVDDGIEVSQVWKRFAPDWHMPEAPDPLHWSGKNMAGSGEVDRNPIEFDWAGETIRHIGSIVHRCIQHMAVTGLEHWDRERLQAARPWYESMLRQLGVREPDLKSACEDVMRALGGLLEDERGQWILSPEHVDAQDEHALTGLYDGHVTSIRIDRTFIDRDGVRWIIDYKTSRHVEADIEQFLDREQERYRGQMEKYAAIMRGMEQRPIRLGLYFPLLQGWRSWDASPDY